MKKYAFYDKFVHQTVYCFVCLLCKGGGTREQSWRMSIDLPLAFCVCELYFHVASGTRARRAGKRFELESYLFLDFSVAIIC